MKRVLLILLVIMFMYSCSMLQPQPSVCDKPEASESVICKITGGLHTTPEQVDFLLQLSAAVALDANPSEAGIALIYLDKAIALLDGEDVTYSLLSKYLKGSMPATFVVVTNGLLPKMLTIDSVIKPFDKGLIRTHLERQRILVKIKLGDGAVEKETINGVTKLVSPRQRLAVAK